MATEPLPIPLTGKAQIARALALIPLLVGLGVSAGVGTGVAGISSAFYLNNRLHSQVVKDLREITQLLRVLQEQISFLASVVLQNRRGLDVLTAKEGGLCVFLKEECCFFVNQSGVIQDRIKQFQDSLECRR